MRLRRYTSGTGTRWLPPPRSIVTPSGSTLPTRTAQASLLVFWSGARLDTSSISMRHPSVHPPQHGSANATLSTSHRASAMQPSVTPRWKACRHCLPLRGRPGKLRTDCRGACALDPARVTRPCRSVVGCVQGLGIAIDDEDAFLDVTSRPLFSAFAAAKLPHPRQYSTMDLCR